MANGDFSDRAHPPQAMGAVLLSARISLNIEPALRPCVRTHVLYALGRFLGRVSSVGSRYGMAESPRGPIRRGQRRRLVRRSRLRSHVNTTVYSRLAIRLSGAVVCTGLSISARVPPCDTAPPARPNTSKHARQCARNALQTAGGGRAGCVEGRTRPSCTS